MTRGLSEGLAPSLVRANKDPQEQPICIMQAINKKAIKASYVNTKHNLLNTLYYTDYVLNFC